MELLVALMISSLLVTVIYQLMAGNSRYVQLQSSREEVQQKEFALKLVYTRGVDGGDVGAGRVQRPGESGRSADEGSLGLELAPGGGVPDLEPVPDADHDHVALESGVVPEMGRDADPALLVGALVGGRRREHADVVTGGLVGHGRLAQPADLDRPAGRHPRWVLTAEGVGQ